MAVLGASEYATTGRVALSLPRTRPTSRRVPWPA